MKFEWDPQKAQINLRKHEVSFEEALTVFKDTLAFIFDDLDHSAAEHREIIIGTSAAGRIVIVCFVERSKNTIRIFSARRAAKNEIKNYEKNAEKINRS